MADKLPEEMTNEEILAAMAAPAEPPAEPPKAAEPSAKATFEFKAGDGTIYTAETQEELFQKITGALDNTKVALKDRERQIHELRQPKPVEKPKPTETFNQETYVSLLEKNAIDAQEYLDKFRAEPEWAIKAREIAADLQAKQTLRQEVDKFYASPAGQQYVKMETPESNAALLKYMADEGLDQTAANFRVAFYELKEAGIIKAPTGEPAKRAKVTPKSPDGVQDTPVAEPDLNRMNKKELAEYMRSKGLEVHYVG